MYSKIAQTERKIENAQKRKDKRKKKQKQKQEEKEKKEQELNKLKLYFKTYSGKYGLFDMLPNEIWIYIASMDPVVGDLLIRYFPDKFVNLLALTVPLPCSFCTSLACTPNGIIMIPSPYINKSGKIMIHKHKNYNNICSCKKKFYCNVCVESRSMCAGCNCCLCVSCPTNRHMKSAFGDYSLYDYKFCKKCSNQKVGICKINICNNKYYSKCFKCNLEYCYDHISYYADYFDRSSEKYNRVIFKVKPSDIMNKSIKITNENYCCINCLKQVLDTEICKI